MSIEKLQEAAHRRFVEMDVDYSLMMHGQYDLILEAELSSVSDRIVFIVNGTKCYKNFITEVRLPQNDVFVFDQWSLYLLNTKGSEDVGFDEYMYPDQRAFPESEQEDGRIFYKSLLSLYINNALMFPPRVTDVFENELPKKYFQFPGRCLFTDVGRVIFLIGTKNIVFHLDLPRKIKWPESTTRIRLRLRGLLFMNASIVIN